MACGPGVRTVSGGADPQRLQTLLKRELEHGAIAIMSFGIAGGLVAGLVPGSWIVARQVVTTGSHWPADAAWLAVLIERLPGARVMDLAGSADAVMRAADKRALHEATGAGAVDMESHVAAAFAATHGLPFAAFRVVCDPVERDLPPAAHVGVARDGSTDVRAVLQSLWRAPAQLAPLVRTAVDAALAARALSRGRRRLGSGLGYPDFGKLLLDVV